MRDLSRPLRAAGAVALTFVLGAAAGFGIALVVRRHPADGYAIQTYHSDDPDDSDDSDDSRGPHGSADSGNPTDV